MGLVKHMNPFFCNKIVSSMIAFEPQLKEGNRTYQYLLILIKRCHTPLLPPVVVTTSPIHHGDLSHSGHHKPGYASFYHSIIYIEQTALSVPLLLHSPECPKNIHAVLVTTNSKMQIRLWAVTPYRTMMRRQIPW